MRTFGFMLLTAWLCFGSSVMGQQHTLGGQAYYQIWRIGENKISEWSFPVSYRAAIKRNVNVTIAGGLSRANQSASDNRFEAPTDTRIRLNTMLLGEKLLLSAGLNLPTGKTQLNNNERLAVFPLSNNALDFKIPGFGRGGGAHIGSVFAQEVTPGIALGGGISFLLNRPFQPFQDGKEYHPGNEVSLTSGMDIGNKQAKLSGDVSFTYYGADKRDGETVFKSGAKTFLRLVSRFNLGVLRAHLGWQYRSKGKNEKGAGLLSEAENSNGKQQEIYGSLGLVSRKGSVLKMVFDIKEYARNGFEVNGASITGFGGGFEVHVKNLFSWEMIAKYASGNLKDHDIETPVDGLEFGGHLRIGW